MAATDGCNDDGWSPYSNEKCFKVFQHATTNFEEAEAFCTQQTANGGGGEDDNEALKSNSNDQIVPRLLTIDNFGQQAFVEKLLFEKSFIDTNSNIWLGGKFENDGFRWRRNYGRSSGGGVELDQERLDNGEAFSNWQSGHPSTRAEGYCLEMITGNTGDDMKKGAWIEQPCANRPKNQVVCERPQQWPAAKLQEHLIKLQEHLIKLQQTVQTMIPIGFTYVQLPKDRAPTELWPYYGWDDVSHDYDSNFFRVVGQHAKPFGEVQQQHTPYIIDISQKQCKPAEESNCKEGDGDDSLFKPTVEFTNYNGFVERIEMNTVLTGTFIKGNDDDLVSHYLEIMYQGGEIRPTNMGVKVWRRIA